MWSQAKEFLFVMSNKAFFYLHPIHLFSLLLVLMVPAFGTKINSQELSSVCQQSVLERLQRHQLAPGETITSVANAYNLLPATLMSVNSLSGTPAVGTEILIPPFNGIRVQVRPGADWKDLEAAYGVRADVLFEVNGCQKIPEVVFVPGVHWGTNQAQQSNNYNGLTGYPLPQSASVGLGYGWHTNPTSQQTQFHSGLDLLVDLDTPVLAAEDGTVTFVGPQGDYGNLVVINHPGGRQTRYAHLAQITVQPGQNIQSGQALGTVGNTGKPDLDAPHLHFEVRHNSPVGWVAQDPQIHLQTNAQKRVKGNAQLKGMLESE